MAFNSDYGGFGNSSSGGGGGGGQGVLITDAATIATLVAGPWTNNVYGGVPITGQNTGDFYDSGTIRYYIRNGSGATRIPYQYL
jgi:hypothetical protein